MVPECFLGRIFEESGANILSINNEYMNDTLLYLLKSFVDDEDCLNTHNNL